MWIVTETIWGKEMWSQAAAGKQQLANSRRCKIIYMVVTDTKLPSIGRTDIWKSHSHDLNMRKIILQDSILPIIFLKYFLSGVVGSFENIYGRGR